MPETGNAADAGPEPIETGGFVPSADADAPTPEGSGSEPTGAADAEATRKEGTADGEEDADKGAALVERIKAGTATTNDIEMMQRWMRKGGYRERDTLKDFAAEMAAQFQDGPAFLAEHGPRVTLERIIAMQKQAGAGKAPPAPDPVAELRARLEKMESDQLEARLRAEVDHTIGQFGDLDPKVRKFLADDVMARWYTADDDQEVSDFVRERYEVVRDLFGLAEKKGKAETVADAKKRAALAKPGGAPASQPEKGAKGEKPATLGEGDKLTLALDRAIDKAMPAETAT